MLLHTVFGNGRSPESLFERFSSVGSLARVYGAITFILDSVEMDANLKDQDCILEEYKARHPMSVDMIERFERGKMERIGIL